MKKIFLLICLCLSVHSYAQEEKDSLASQLAEKARVFADAFKFDSAFHYFDIALNRLDSLGEKRLYHLTVLNQAYAYNLMGETQKALELLDQTRVEAAEFGDDHVTFETYRNYALVYESQRLFDKALEYYKLAEENLPKAATREAKGREISLYVGRGVASAQSNDLVGAERDWTRALDLLDSMTITDDRVAVVLNNLANVTSNMGFTEEALLYYLRAVDIYLGMFGDPYHPNLIQIYYNMSLVYTDLSLFHQGLEYQHLSRSALSRIAPNHPFMVSINLQLAGSYLELDEYDTANYFVKDALQLNLKLYGEKHRMTLAAYQTLGTLEGKIGDFQSSVEYLTKAKELLSEVDQGIDLELVSAINHSLGLNQVEIDQVEEGLSNLKLSIQQVHEWIGPKGNDPATYNNNLAGALYSLDRLEEALDVYQASLIANIPDFNSTDITENPVNIVNSSNSYEVYESLVGKLLCLEELYYKTNERSFLRTALSVIPQMNEASAIIQQKPNIYGDKFKFQDYLAKPIKSAIRVYHELWKLENNDQYLEDIYGQFERNKSNLIISKLQEKSQFAQIQELPDSLSFERQSALKRISFLEAAIDEEKYAENTNSQAIEEYNDELFYWRDREERISNFIKENFSQFYSWRMDQFIPSLSQIQSELLSSDEVMYHYHLTEQKLFYFRIDKDEISLESRDIDNEFYSRLKRFLALCYDPTSSLEEYLSTSDYLVSILGLEAETLKQYNKLIIVPDQLLSLLPFEVLAMPSETKPQGYDQIDYLVKNLSVSYANSSSLLSLQESASKFRDIQAVAFAPTYDDVTADFRGIDTVRAGLGSLVWTEAEVNNLGNYFETTAFLGDDASEQNFLETAADYAIVHVAGHGLINDQSPLFSKLVFSPSSKDSLNDGFVNTRELFDLQIPAELVVLSACNSGYGGLVNGEGVISLANGFFYAGSKSAIMTLWQANDESSAATMSYFYKNLSEGMAKSEALRMAKLQFLEEADQLRSHPYYWAHFVVNGDASPLVQSGIPWWAWWLAGIVVIVLVRRSANARKRAI